MDEGNDARISAGQYAPGQAPRVTEQDIDETIVDRTFVVMPDGRTTICQLTLKNGYTVRGESSCVSIENFDADKGKKYSFERARQEIWQLEGYLLAQRKYEDSVRYAGN